MQLLEVFARQTSSAISNCALHNLIQVKNHQLNDAYHQLQTSYMEMISTMRRIVDAKDTYTRGHSDRVSYYAAQLARRMGKGEEYCEQVRLAGLFHDVGKLSHPKNGVELLSVISHFRPVLPAILNHHERIDGSGYPNGLRGEQIPEEARIVAVVDTFDAMTSDRQYRKALTVQRAMEELNRYKGTQLDAQVVDAFLDMIQNQDFWNTMQKELTECPPPITGGTH